MTTIPRTYRALVLDDDPEWRALLTKTLQIGRIAVDAVPSPDALRQNLDRSLYHLIIFDISMSEGFDRDGLDLLVELYRSTRIDSAAIIVLSSYATVEAAKEVLEGHSNAKLFRKQDFVNIKFLDEVLKLLSKAVPLNLNLDVVWQRGEGESGGSDILRNLRIAGERVRKSEPSLFDRVEDEFIDLLARMFHDAERVVLTPMVPGRSGAGVVKVRPVLRLGGGAAVVLKFGDVADIETENTNYEQYVKPFLSGARLTSIQSRAHTWLLGGTCYSLLGASEFSDFTSFYASASEEQVCDALNNLFRETCSAWYENTGPLTDRDLGREYVDRLGMDAAGLNSSLQKLRRVRAGTSLEFTSLPGMRKLPNPLRAVMGGPMVYWTHEAVTHGDLNGSNIIVDRHGSCWLIDFFNTGPGHALRDFALLDGAIRWTMLRAEEATLEERLAMEYALLDADQHEAGAGPKSNFETNNELLHKAFRTTLHIRSLAAEQSRKRTMSEVPDYGAATMLYGLNLVRFLQTAEVQREHALLSAALQAERLHLS